MMQDFRKKPVTVQAVQLSRDSFAFIIDMLVKRYRGIKTIESVVNSHVTIPTLEGDMKLMFGDWLIRGVEGELYPCKDSIFRKTYSKLTIEEAVEHE